MTKREELIQKVKDGKVAILNDGNINQLREVILWCFPNDKAGLAGTSWVYIASTANYSHWAANNEKNKPTVSIKEFYKDEFVWGEEVEASSDNQHWVNNRFFAGKNPINKNYIAVSEYGLLQQYKYIRKLPLKIKLTHQMIADKFDIDVNNLEII